MKQRQFTDEQIVGILQEAEKGITQTTFYRWRNRCGGVTVKEAQRLRVLEKEKLG